MKKIAIAGNPNSGKTCLFNLLTGSMQRVGNYPGVTVELVSGEAKFGDEKVEIIDLPGTYSLNAYSQEEVVARNFIVDEKPDIIINVIDVSNLERNLYLTAQLIELEVPIILALNMVDVAEKKGLQIDIEQLSQVMGVKAVFTAANKRRGIDELKAVSLAVLEQPTKPHRLSYSHELQNVLPPLKKVIENHAEFCGHFPSRWVAVKLLEDDGVLLKKLNDNNNFAPINAALKIAKQQLRHHSNEESTTAVVEARYAFAGGVVRQTVKEPLISNRMLTDIIDRVVCQRFFGPLFLGLIVYLLFLFVFKCADDLTWIPVSFSFNEWVSPTGLCQLSFDALGNLANQYITLPWLRSLVADGIIGGVGGVMSFVPLIFFMFLFLSVLEDSGYIARVAFILDRVLRIFGLQGKSILAMIVSGGFGAGGCAVPGVMATRTLRDEKDRLITILVAPFMNCGAKMPVYAMLIAAFFVNSRGLIMLVLWLLSWCFALGAAWVLRKTIFKGEQTPFVMELPVYHLPTLRGILTDTWNRTWMYIKKAATIILAINIIIWALMYYPRYEPTAEDVATKQVQAKQLQYSFAGRLGTALTPLSQFAGFDWRENIALVGGFAAKEVVLGTLGTAYAMENVDADNSQSLSERLAVDPDWDRLKAFVFLVFIMAYAPCFVTIAAIKKETGKWRWAIFSTVYSTTLAFVVAVLIYQVGLLLF
ncbi:MAG: ferrous iron transport protein B [Victivallaceae bacterium]|nr:ferrous iron transport protein B [Victivallaceae bacterium]